ncbi:MAG: hypothetical protein LBC23_00870 [Coriobacteriales bacterium]|jgi:cell wall-associated NlpC family hydrolase|nr:hypothetical protein [Coriobacteriales bacterium]
MRKQNREKQDLEVRGGSGKWGTWAAFCVVSVLGLGALTIVALTATDGIQSTGDNAVAEVAIADDAVPTAAPAATSDDADEKAPSTVSELSVTRAGENPVGTEHVVAGIPAIPTTPPAAEEVPIADLSEPEVLALEDEVVVANAAEIADSAEVGELIAQAQDELGRDFTSDELAVLASGLKAQYAYDQALSEGRADEQQFTVEEQKAIDEAALLQTNVSPTSTSSAVSPGSEGTSGKLGGFNPGGNYAPGIGVYPTQKGKILVTADWYKNNIPTGHSAIVIDQSSAYTALAEGVTIEPNDWYEPSRHQTAFGLDVVKTTDAQEAKAADWCKKHLGKPYNYLYILPERTDAFYCSSLVWRAYKDTTGVNLDTSAFNVLGFKAVHPMELVDSSQTSIVYLQGNARIGKQTVNGVKYTIGLDGRPR